MYVYSAVAQWSRFICKTLTRVLQCVRPDLEDQRLRSDTARNQVHPTGLSLRGPRRNSQVSIVNQVHPTGLSLWGPRRNPQVSIVNQVHPTGLSLWGPRRNSQVSIVNQVHPTGLSLWGPRQNSQVNQLFFRSHFAAYVLVNVKFNIVSMITHTQKLRMDKILTVCL